MRIATLFLATAALLAAAACGKKTETPAPDPAKPGPEKLVKDNGPPLDCNALIPQEARDKYFAGYAFKPSTQKTNAGKIMNCAFTKDTDVQMVQVVCQKIGEDSVGEIFGNMRKSMTEVKDVSGIGKQAYVGMQNGKKILRFRDDDTLCYGSIMAPEPSEDLAKSLVANLTPAAFM